MKLIWQNLAALVRGAWRAGLFVFGLLWPLGILFVLPLLILWVPSYQRDYEVGFTPNQKFDFRLYQSQGHLVVTYVYWERSTVVQPFLRIKALPSSSGSSEFDSDYKKSQEVVELNSHEPSEVSAGCLAGTGFTCWHPTMVPMLSLIVFFPNWLAIGVALLIAYLSWRIWKQKRKLKLAAFEVIVDKSIVTRASGEGQIQKLVSPSSPPLVNTLEKGQ